MSTLSPIEQARFNMIEQQIRPWKVLNQRVLDLFKKIPREAFVNEAYRSLAFSEARIPISNNDKMLFPALEGRILQEMKIEANESVLIVGTGSGFLTACAAHLGEKVVSIDINNHYIEKAKAVTDLLTLTNIAYKTADISEDLKALGTYDAVIITASLATIPQHFFDLLNEGGRLFSFVGNNPTTQATIYYKLAGHIQERSFFEIEMERLAGFEDKPTFSF